MHKTFAKEQLTSCQDSKHVPYIKETLKHFSKRSRHATTEHQTLHKNTGNGLKVPKNEGETREILIPQ